MDVRGARRPRGARALHEGNLVRTRALANKQLEGQTLGGLASLALDEGRAQDAVTLLKEVLRIDRDRAIRLQTSMDLTRFARALASAGGAAVDAVRLLACAEALREEIGTAGPPYLKALPADALTVLRTELDEVAFAGAWEAGRRLTVDEAVALALDTKRDA
jgi:hypothetical protein